MRNGRPAGACPGLRLQCRRMLPGTRVSCWVLAVLVIAAAINPMTVWAQTAEGNQPNQQQRAGTGANSNNKWKNRTPVELERLIFGLDSSSRNEDEKHCHFDLDLVWKAQLGSPVFTTPLITDLEGDGRKEIIVTTQDYYVEALQGVDGHKASGFPFAFSRSHFQASPLLYDRNGDGREDIVVATVDGEIVFIHQNGTPIYGETLKVPQLRVKKDWFVGLDAKNIAASLALHEQPPDTPPPIPDGQDGPESLPPKRKLLSIELDQEAVTFDKDAIWQGVEGWLPQDGVESLELFLPTDTPASYLSSVESAKDPLYAPSYRNGNPEAGYVHVDAHILAAPVLSDLEGDGFPELVVAVSYYFDTKQYSHPDKIKELEADVDISKYVAGGVIVFDLTKRAIKFSVPLDISTDHALYRAHIYASPTVADLDGDGSMDIMVPTALGYIYYIFANGSLNFNGFPQMMDAIYSPLVVEDVNGDGKLEIVAVDINANIVCFDQQGEEVWENRLSGVANQAAALGDINGDGVLDVVVATDVGHIWAFSGDKGTVIKNFPIKVEGMVYARPLVVDLTDEGSAKPHGLHIVVTAHNGHVYIIDPRRSCIDSIDLGEHAYGMVLADDVTGDGKMDLIIAGKKGHVFALQSSAPYHPLKAWTSDEGLTVRHNWHGVHVLGPSRVSRDISGHSFVVHFEIVDNRPSTSRGGKPQYNITFSLHGADVLQRQYSQPGVYSETLPCPNERVLRSIVRVQMINELRQKSVDSFAISCNKFFAKTMKWILVLPFIVCAFVLVFLKELRTPLPYLMTHPKHAQEGLH